jgi:hypothetical protein
MRGDWLSGVWRKYNGVQDVIYRNTIFTFVRHHYRSKVLSTTNKKYVPKYYGDQRMCVLKNCVGANSRLQKFPCMDNVCAQLSWRLQKFSCLDNIGISSVGAYASLKKLPSGVFRRTEEQTESSPLGSNFNLVGQILPLGGEIRTQPHRVMTVMSWCFFQSVTHPSRLSDLPPPSTLSHRPTRRAVRIRADGRGDRQHAPIPFSSSVQQPNHYIQSLKQLTHFTFQTHWVNSNSFSSTPHSIYSTLAGVNFNNYVFQAKVS